MKKAVTFLTGATWLTGKAALGVTKGLAKGVRVGAREIVRHREEITEGTSGVVGMVGGALVAGGRAVANAARPWQTKLRVRVPRVRRMGWLLWARPCTAQEMG